MTKRKLETYLDKFIEYSTYSHDAASYCNTTVLYDIIRNQDYKLLKFIVDKKPRLFTEDCMANELLFLSYIENYHQIKQFVKYKINLNQKYKDYISIGNQKPPNYEQYTYIHIIKFIINQEKIVNHPGNIIDNKFKLLKLLYNNRKRVNLNSDHFKVLTNKYKLLKMNNLYLKQIKVKYYDINLNNKIFEFY